MTFNTFSSGVNTSFSSQLNTNFSFIPKIVEVYTGTGLNNSASSSSSTPVTNELSYEMASINASDLTNITYIEVVINGNSTGSGNIDTTFSNLLKIQSKDLSGSYVDTPAYYTEHSIHATGSIPIISSTIPLILHYFIPVTSNMRVNGARIKVFTECSATGSSGPTQNVNCSLTIVQASCILIGR